jgi:nitrate/TMAO reductase-like tetraheme cytochrome c subunit
LREPILGVSGRVPHAGPWLGYLAIASAFIAAAILLHFLIKRPVLDVRTKLMLLLGLGVFPAICAGTSTVAGMEQTTHREFCGSCHTMDDHFANATDPHSQSLAARHTRNPFFGEESCYVCHADYGMFGYALTKMGGMGHVYYYYLGGWRGMSKEETRKNLHISKPYDNMNCRQCHTTTAHMWRSVPDHTAMQDQLFANKVSCASPGCHGYAHPFSKGANALGTIGHAPAGAAP